MTSNVFISRETVLGPCDLYLSPGFREKYREHDFRIELADLVLDSFEENIPTIESYGKTSVIIGQEMAISSQILADFTVYMTITTGGDRHRIILHSDANEMNSFIAKLAKQVQGETVYDSRKDENKTLH